jgi:serine/threonine-protein kinase HipA
VNDTLVVRLGESAVGHIEQSQNALQFTYDDLWTNSSVAYPLSLSMPLFTTQHPDAVVRPWLEGLLPDNETVLRSWARKFKASARNPFSLLRHVGQDLPGAVQLLPPDEVASVTEQPGSVAWLDDREVERRLSGLVENHAAWRLPGDTGYFSLAGAQPKTAFLLQDGRWGIPSGRIPTTHLLKPPALEGMDGLPENEHLCLRLAGALGIPAADSSVAQFGEQPCLVVKRYDRSETPGGIHRIHQEDCCQALAVSPLEKYEKEGGPSASSIVGLLRDHSSAPNEDISVFVRAQALYWAIGATDAHGKNYSVLLAPGGQVRLAPLYDVLTILPYPTLFHAPEEKLAMRIGGEDRLGRIARRHWERWAEESSLSSDWTVNQVREVVERIPSLVEHLCAQARTERLSHDFIDRFETSTIAHARRAQATLS